MGLRQQPDKFFDTQVGLPDDGAKRSSGNFLVVRDGEWRASGMAQVNVTTFLASDRVSKNLKSFDYFLPRDNGQFAHKETSRFVSLTLRFRNKGRPSSNRVLT